MNHYHQIVNAKFTFLNVLGLSIKDKTDWLIEWGLFYQSRIFFWYIRNQLMASGNNILLCNANREGSLACYSYTVTRYLPKDKITLISEWFWMQVLDNRKGTTYLKAFIRPGHGSNPDRSHNEQSLYALSIDVS